LWGETSSILDEIWAGFDPEMPQKIGRVTSGRKKPNAMQSIAFGNQKKELTKGISRNENANGL
jgi:hypothetical protein